MSDTIHYAERTQPDPPGYLGRAYCGTLDNEWVNCVKANHLDRAPETYVTCKRCLKKLASVPRHAGGA